MEWISPVSTALGAGIGVGATLLADRLRWRREREDRALETRQQLYAEYSAALSRIRTALNEAANDSGLSDDDRRAWRVSSSSRPGCTSCATSSRSSRPRK
ncbi:hypothetical protein GCM10009801_27820 [Streptomyces albiaxialis]|uniref:Uncharacterized protein n=1 Tax=Streptomyces albiaxialis TaxID=329523 RepID=A0ABN2VW44_9ACTN